MRPMLSHVSPILFKLMLRNHHIIKVGKIQFDSHRERCHVSKGWLMKKSVFNRHLNLDPILLEALLKRMSLFVAVSCVKMQCFRQCTLSPVIIEVESYPNLEETHLGGTPIFHVHDWRKSITWDPILKLPFSTSIIVG